MLVLARRINERIMIGDSITIEITDISSRHGQVKIGISAPAGVKILREELVGRDAARDAVLAGGAP